MHGVDFDAILRYVTDTQEYARVVRIAPTNELLPRCTPNLHFVLFSAGEQLGHPGSLSQPGCAGELPAAALGRCGLLPGTGSRRFTDRTGWSIAPLRWLQIRGLARLEPYSAGQAGGPAEFIIQAPASLYHLVTVTPQRADWVDESQGWGLLETLDF